MQRSRTLAALLCCCCLAVVGTYGLLHDDEVGKRDWYIPSVGRVLHASFVSTPAVKQVFVASNEGVVAALSTLDKGTIRWRHLLGEAQVCISSSPSSTVVVSTSGVGHVFGSAQGNVLSTFSVNVTAGAAITDCVFDHAANTVSVVAIAKKSVSIFTFRVDDYDTVTAGPIAASKTFTASSAVSNAKWAGSTKLWVERNGTGIDVYDAVAKNWTGTDSRGFIESTTPTGHALLSFYQGQRSDDAGRRLYTMVAEGKTVKAVDKPTLCKECRVMIAAPQDDPAANTSLIVVTREKPTHFTIVVGKQRAEVPYPGHLPPRVISARGTSKRVDMLLRSSNNHLLLVSLTSDGEATIAWERYEGISSPAAARVVPLPSLASPSHDLFGFDVHALVVSTYGTLYRIPVASKGDVIIVVADLAAHLRETLKIDCGCGATYSDVSVSDEGIATVVAAFAGNTVHLRVEASTGIFVGASGVAAKPAFASPLMLVDKDLKVVEPAANTKATPQYLHRVDAAQGIISGYVVFSGAQAATPTWTMNLKGPIVASAAPKDRLTVLTVDNLRVFPNASTKVNEVRKRYPTHNTLVVAVMSAEEDERLTILVMDSVTGTILATTQHSSVMGAVHIAIVEHMVVYHFLNTERMRYALGVLELFEREDVILSDATATSPAQIVSSFFVSQKSFSSLTTKPPHVNAMVLAFPGGALNAVGVTTSYQGINRKQLIFALADGHVHAVDLRQVMFGGQANPQKPEEVYQHVTLPPVNIISHVHNVANAKIVATTPTELESSAHVLVAGLDTFYTRVSPGKAFDMLNDDFNHQLLLIVCGAMGLLSIITRKFASRKALKLQWA